MRAATPMADAYEAHEAALVDTWHMASVNLDDVFEPDLEDFYAEWSWRYPMPAAFD